MRPIRPEIGLLVPLPFRCSFLLASAALLWACQGLAASVKCTLLINTSPQDAAVVLTTVPIDRDPKRCLVFSNGISPGNGWVTPPFRYSPGDAAQIVVRAPDYEAQTNLIGFDRLSAQKASDKNPYVVNVTLQRLREKFEVELLSVDGAKFSINHVAVEGTNASLVFTRSNAAAAWDPVTVTAERPMYKTVVKTCPYKDIEALPPRNGRRQVVVPLSEVERQLKLNLSANEQDGKVMLDGKEVGKVPGEITVSFTRLDGDSPWSKHLVRVEKEGYEYRPPSLTLDQTASPAFETNLTIEVATKPELKLHLPDFQPMNFFQVPMRRFVITRGEVILEYTNSVSGKDPKDNVVLSEFGRNTRGELFFAGRMGAATSTNSPGKPGDVVIALPLRESRQGQPAEIVGSSIWILTAGGARKRVTDAEPGVFDIDPCITKDARTIYFSSNRRGQWGIWKKAATSGGGRYPVDQGQGVDVEPTVFSTPDGANRVAFTRYFPKAAAGTPPRIVVQGEDGSSFAETEAGRCPAWSNDGTRIAYVSPDRKIWWMQANGENPQQVTTGKSIDDTPVWLPGDRQIGYASAAGAEQARDGTGNFDIWKVDDRGNNPQQLVANPSFDGWPAMTSEAVIEGGKNAVCTFLYFLSNRGAQRTADEAWRIYCFQLP